VRLVVIGTIVIDHFFTLLLFKAPALLTPVFDPDVCISAADDVAQILIIRVLSLAVFHRCSETACRVPVRTLSVVNLMTSCFVITVECWINHG
jgi:hypothetical protein